jgi:hypothetical protein
LNLRHSRFTATAKTLDPLNTAVVPPRGLLKGRPRSARAIPVGRPPAARIRAAMISTAAPSMSVHATAAPSRRQRLGSGAADAAARTRHQRHFSPDAAHRDPPD